MEAEYKIARSKCQKAANVLAAAASVHREALKAKDDSEASKLELKIKTQSLEQQIADLKEASRVNGRSIARPNVVSFRHGLFFTEAKKKKDLRAQSRLSAGSISKKKEFGGVVSKAKTSIRRSIGNSSSSGNSSSVLDLATGFKHAGINVSDIDEDEYSYDPFGLDDILSDISDP